MSRLARFGRGGDDPPSSAGKVVVVHCDAGQGGGVFRDVRLVRVGFGHFLDGREVELEAWREGTAPNVAAWFDTNQIGQLYLSGSIEEARRAYRADEF